jgi:hypothetical protein
MNNIPEVGLCPNCRRSTTNHRPWCGDVQTTDAPVVGQTIDHPLLGCAELISVYTRSDAIEDGILVDCTQEPFDGLNRNAGIKFDVAVTSAVFGRYIEVPEEFRASQDIAGRYWDMVFMFTRAALRKRTVMELLFDFICLPNGPGCWNNERPGPSPQDRLVQLKAVSGPGDRGEPCLTFMLPSED